MSRVTVLMCALICAAACDESPTAPTVEEISGRWVVSSLQPVSAAAIAPPSGALALQFEGERVSVQGDCNTCGGGFTLSNGTIALSPLACTRRGCPEGSLDDVFFGLVSTAHTATGSPSTLILEGPQGRLSLQR